MVSNYFSKLLENTKALQIPQIVFLLLSYYLVANSIYKAVSSKYNLQLPKVLLTKNTKVLEVMHDWCLAVLVLGALLLIIGFINTLLGYLPILENYIVFKQYSGIGWFIGAWFIVISLMFYIYELIPNWFFVPYIIIVFIVAMIHEETKRIQQKQV